MVPVLTTTCEPSVPVVPPVSALPTTKSPVLLMPPATDGASIAARVNVPELVSAPVRVTLPVVVITRVLVIVGTDREPFTIRLPVFRIEPPKDTALPARASEPLLPMTVRAPAPETLPLIVSRLPVTLVL